VLAVEVSCFGKHLGLQRSSSTDHKGVAKPVKVLTSVVSLSRRWLVWLVRFRLQGLSRLIRHSTGVLQRRLEAVSWWSAWSMGVRRGHSGTTLRSKLTTSKLYCLLTKARVRELFKVQCAELSDCSMVC